MTEEHHLQKLFSEFNSAKAADWEEKARKDLRGEPLESLFWHTYEGFAIKPYYTSQDLQNLPFTIHKPGDFPFLRGNKTSSNGWLNIQQVMAENNGHTAIAKATDALSRGADGINFVINEEEDFDIAQLIQAIDLSSHTISYTLKNKPDLFLKKVYQALHQKQISPRNLKGFINYNPVSRSGKLEKKEQKIISNILDLTKESPEFYGITVCGTNFSSIGASVTQEIAYTLSAAVAYIDLLTNAGQPLESVLRNVQFCMASGTNYFFEIVKLRVIRLLWATIVHAYKTEPAMAAHLRIHSTTSSWYQTTLDPYVNMLRATTEAMSAIIAGCDSLTVVPFDSTFKKPDEFSERIARNVSIILKEEAYLDKAIDPAAGSYYLESLTNELATKAWNLFKEVEAQGGFEQAYESEFILGSITEISRKKFHNVATGRDVLVGTNKYPNSNESLSFDPEALIQSEDFDTTRAAYPTEVMRLATALHLRKRKRRPRAIITTIGGAEQHRVNTAFAQEFFSCSGFETVHQPFASVHEAADKLDSASAEVVVVSSSEEAYAREFGPRLRNHHAKPTIILAGDPQHMKEEMLANGYEEFIFEGCDMTKILNLVQKRLAQDNNNGA